MQDYGYAFSEPLKLPEVKETSPPMATEENTIKPIDVNKNSCKNEFLFDLVHQYILHLIFHMNLKFIAVIFIRFSVTDDSSSSSNED